LASIGANPVLFSWFFCFWKKFHLTPYPLNLLFHLFLGERVHKRLPGVHFAAFKLAVPFGDILPGEVQGLAVFTSDLDGME
jgi:hypothetical protein